MATNVEVEPETVVVSLTGPDRIFALKGRLNIPRRRITSVEVKKRRDVRSEARPSWLRMPGAHVSGLIRHGSYGIDPQREFWAVYRQEEVIVTSVSAWRYVRVILGLPNPHHLPRLFSSPDTLPDNSA